MFKYKVSIYLKSGNIIKLKLKDYEFNNNKNNFTFTKKYGIIKDESTEAVIIKKWWQKWG